MVSILAKYMYPSIMDGVQKAKSTSSAFKMNVVDHLTPFKNYMD